jgi:hypothetical protein
MPVLPFVEKIPGNSTIQYYFFRIFLERVLRFHFSDNYWKDCFTVYYIFGLNKTFLLSTNEIKRKNLSQELGKCKFFALN